MLRSLLNYGLQDRISAAWFIVPELLCNDELVGLRLPACFCRRDEALAAVQDSIRAQQQQELAIGTEIQGYKKDINKEQVSLRQLSTLLAAVHLTEGHSC